jgi:DNA-binding transcriptional ArsR family regulator
MLNQSAELDLAFQALADPTRRVLVEQLAQAPASVSALAKPLAMSLPAVLQHIAVLEHAGLVTTRKEGRVRTCRLEPARLEAVEHWLAAQRAEWTRRLDRLDAYLGELQEGDNNVR